MEALNEIAPQVHERGHHCLEDLKRLCDAEVGFREAALVLENEYRTRLLRTAAFGHEAALPTGYQVLSVWSTTQIPQALKSSSQAEGGGFTIAH